MDKVTLKFTALNKEVATAEETFTIRQLKERYPKLWLKSNQDYQIFINFCMEKWAAGQEDLTFNVVVYSIESLM